LSEALLKIFLIILIVVLSKPAQVFAEEKYYCDKLINGNVSGAKETLTQAMYLDLKITNDEIVTIADNQGPLNSCAGSPSCSYHTDSNFNGGVPILTRANTLISGSDRSVSINNCELCSSADFRLSFDRANFQLRMRFTLNRLGFLRSTVFDVIRECHPVE
jgi:hypothetical protein